MKHTLLWLDLEMTGLLPEKDCILQCAVAVTDDQLSVVTQGVEYVISTAPEALAHMHHDVLTMHTKSGLLERIAQSKLSLVHVEDALIAFFNTYCEPQKTLLCGNSIWVDRTFLRRHMPRLEALFYYRMVDVSTIKELVVRWYPTLTPFPKKKNHTALADLHESIAELGYYKENIFCNTIL